MPFSLIAGLGNPGSEYQGTRHNVGFDVVDALANSLSASWQSSKNFKAEVAQTEIEGESIRLIKPLDFMNNSGIVLNKFFGYCKTPPSQAIIVYDDVTLELGACKIMLGGSSAGHNGVQDIINRSANTFVRFRIGIGAKKHKEMDLSDHVLGKLGADEKSVLTSQMDYYINGLKFLVKNGVEETMKEFNKRIKINEHNDTKKV